MRAFIWKQTKIERNKLHVRQKEPLQNQFLKHDTGVLLFILHRERHTSNAFFPEAAGAAVGADAAVGAANDCCCSCCSSATAKEGGGSSSAVDPPPNMAKRRSKFATWSEAPLGFTTGASSEDSDLGFSIIILDIIYCNYYYSL